jgi:hypothetical protein
MLRLVSISNGTALWRQTYCSYLLSRAPVIYKMQTLLTNYSPHLLSKETPSNSSQEHFSVDICNAVWISASESIQPSQLFSAVHLSD